MRSPVNTLVIMVAAATLLGGCSLLPGAKPSHTPKPTATQTVKEACTQLEDPAIQVGADLTDGSTLFDTDPTAAAEKIDAAANDFEDAVADVENDDVHDAASGVSDALLAFADLITQVAADPESVSADDLSASNDDVQSSLEALAEVCS